MPSFDSATMDPQQSTAAILSAGSNATLNLQDLLSSAPSEHLLSTGLDLISAAESTHSFDDVPPFPTTARPLVFVNELGPSLFKSEAAFADLPDCHSTHRLTTSPTGPRLRVMMMESLSVKTWASSVFPQPAPPSWLVENDADPVLGAKPSLWVPEGSLFSPQRFTALFRKRLSSGIEEPWNPVDDRLFATASGADLTLVEPNVSMTSDMTLLLEHGSSGDPAQHVYGHTPGSQLVPAIMVSNSTAALPLCLESSHGLNAELPLAVRRGKKMPPALLLGQLMKPELRGVEENSYPGIPTPFLGSPTTCIPVAEQEQEPSGFSMGLAAICADLRSRLPSPPPFSPIEIAPPVTAHPRSRPGLVLPVQDSIASDLDDEEWAFARDLVTDWHSGRTVHAAASPPPSPAGHLAYTSPPADGSFRAAQALLESSDEISSDEEDGARTPVDVKQMRRKTVIIQTSESDLENAEKTEKVLSLAADVGTSGLPSDFDKPVPFETPTPAPSPSLAYTDCDQLSVASSPGSRPSSTASFKPVRGILKEKKSVRFSTVDMFHEYPAAGHSPAYHGADVGASATRNSAAGQLQPKNPVSVLTRRRTLTAAVHKSSPLRESHGPTQAAPAEDPDTRPRSHSPAARQLLDAPLFAGQTMAKHPAVRALSRAQSVSSPRAPSPSRSVGFGAGGAVVGAPKLQSPTPMLLKEQRRAPLRSINIQQSLPVERGPDVLIPVKPTRQSLLPTDRGVPGPFARRVLRAGSIPPAPRHERDENARRRSQPAGKDGSCGAAASPVPGSRSRMSAPLRTILTKFRT
ncbi:hypothetical protein BV20DRAFT_823896 [Pilatotrama ljubarskyi]|nr:hypothetical protein BV20DRAFT_823896 [Pilatotrama ljubarskyi]